MKTFDHVGIFTNEPQPGEFWVDQMKAWMTNPRTHVRRLEYIRFKEKPNVDPKDEKQWRFWNLPHIAFRIDNLEEYTSGKEVINGPFDLEDFARAVFVLEDGAVVEYMEYKRLDVWFEQDTPWRESMG